MAVAGLLVSSTRERPAFALERWVLDALAPVTRVANDAAKGLRDITDRLVRLGRLAQENEELRQRLLELEARDRENARIIEDYNRIRALLRLKDRSPNVVAAANVIGRNPDQWLKMAVIDVGARDGVAENMIVIEPRGVVGRIVRVSQRTSTVLLLTDPQSGVGIITVRSKDAGVASGQAGSVDLETRFFGRSPDIEIGDRIVTSGYGGIFPAGLNIGEVVDISRDSQGLVVRARVRPSVDFDRLTEVLVIEAQPLPAEVAPGGTY